MIFMVNIHYSRASDMVKPDLLTTDPPTRVTAIATASETGAAASWLPSGEFA